MPETTGNARLADELRGFRDRLASILVDKRALADDEAEVKKEIAQRGLNPKILMSLAKQSLETAHERSKRQDFEEQRELYAATLGMSEAPLSDGARARMHPPKPEDDDSPDATTDAPIAPPPHRIRDRSGSDRRGSRRRPWRGSRGLRRQHQDHREPLPGRRPAPTRLGRGLVRGRRLGWHGHTRPSPPPRQAEEAEARRRAARPCLGRPA